MNKRMFEVILIVSIFFLSIFFLLYHIFFDSLCWKNEGFIWKTQQTTSILMWQCKDKFVCNVNNIQYDVLKRSVTAWECRKNKVDYFEPSYYKQKINNL
jgi:hypothetical protein